MQRAVFAPAARQRGAALVVGLMFLVLLTLLATVAMRQSITQERMAGGLRNVTLARNAAESALRLAERSIATNYLTSNGTTYSCSEPPINNLYCANNTQLEAFRNYRGYTVTNAQLYPSARHDFTNTSTAPTAALAAQPSFVISDLGVMYPAGSGSQIEGGSTGTAGDAGVGNNTDIRLYRITARATGGTPTITRAVESTFSSRSKG